MRWQARAKLRFIQTVPNDMSMHTWFHHVLYDTFHLKDGPIVEYEDARIYCMNRQPEAVKRMSYEEMIRTWLQQSEDALALRLRQRGEWS